MAKAYRASWVLVPLLLAGLGCATTVTIPLGRFVEGPRPSIPVYATDRVPFEYEEIALITVNASSWSRFGSVGSEGWERLVAAAEGYQADAIVDLRYAGSVVTGVAVRKVKSVAPLGSSR